MKMRNIAPYFDRQYRIFHRVLKNSRNVHDLRVSIRRMESTIELVLQDHNLRVYSKAAKSLKKIFKILGKKREIDVAIKDGRFYGLDISELQKKQRQMQSLIRRELNSKSFDKLNSHLKLARAELKIDGEINLKKTKARLHKMLRPLAKTELDSFKGIHKVRITVKKMRYTLEAINHPVNRLKTLQDILGKAHDLHVLQRLVGKNPAVRRDERKVIQKAKTIKQVCIDKLYREV